MNPDPRQALASYNSVPMPVAPQADMTFGLDETVANDPQRDADLAAMIANVQALPPPDPQQAMAAYNSAPTPQTSQQAMSSVGGAIDAQQAANMQRAQVAQDAAGEASRLQSSAGVDSAMTSEELRMAQEEHASEVKRLAAGDADRAKDADEVGDSRSTFSKVMGTVAVVLGNLQDQNNLVAGLMQGMNVQTNHGQQIAARINQGIERDIELQRSKLASREKSAGDAKANERQAYADNAQAIQLAHASKIEENQLALQSIASSAASQDAQSAAQSANAELEQRKQGLYMGVLQQREAAKAAADAKARAAAARANKPVATDWGKLTPTQLQALADSDALPAEGYDELKKSRPDKVAEQGAGALTGYTSTQTLGAGDQSVARQIDSATRSLEKDYDTLAALRKKNSGATWDANDTNEAKRVMRSMPAKFSQTFGAGAPSKTEMEMFEESLVDPTSVQLRADPIEVYKRGKQSIRDNATSKLDSYGYKPAPVLFTPDAK